MKKSNENGNNSSPSPDDDVYLPDDQNKRQERENRILVEIAKSLLRGKSQDKEEKEKVILFK